MKMLNRSCFRKQVVAFVAAALLALPVEASDDLTQPLRVSPDGHFLAQPDGKPFFWLADTAWEIFTRLTREEADLYLQDRARKGFNVIQAVAAAGPLSYPDGLKVPNRYGEAPFHAGEISEPNERYFEHVAWVIDKARSYGLRTALLPLFAINEISFKPGELTVPQAEGYARWLSDRLHGKGIVWVLGGDTNPLWAAAKPSVAQAPPKAGPAYSPPMIIADYRALYDAFAKGILEGEGGNPFITYHPTGFHYLGSPEPRTSLYFADRDWLDMNMIQSSHFVDPTAHLIALGGSSGWIGTRNYEPVADEYASSPTRPVIDGEPRFEDLAVDLRKDASKGYWSGYDARNAAYHSVFAGAAGHTYGNHAIWQFYADDGKRYQRPRQGVTWQAAMQRPVTEQLRHLQALMLSRPYFSRMPDQSLIVGDAGEGTAHIGATRDREGRYAMIYLPHGQRVSIDLSRLSGSRIVGWWFDPRTGRAEKIAATFDNNATQTFSPPSNAADHDWILVLEGATEGFAAPGVPLTASLASPRAELQQPSKQRWLKCNTHTHTASFALSDADTPPLEVARWYKQHGYQCLIITDHEHLTDVAPVNAELADGNFLVIPGQEVTQIVKDPTHPQGLRHAHVNGIGMTKPVFPLGFPADFRWSNYSKPDASLYAGWDGGTMQESYRRNVGRIRAQGAIPQINHPNGEFSVLFEHLEDLDGPYLMEIAGSASLGGVSDTGEIALPVEALWDQLLTSGKSVWGVASDDAHHYRTDGPGVSDAGQRWIMIQSQDLTREAVLAALHDGRFYASDGVTLEKYEVTGRLIDIKIDVPRIRNTERRVADRFKTEFIGPGGIVLATVHGTQARYEIKGNHSYVRAVITNSYGRKAWTQPVFQRSSARTP